MKPGSKKTFTLHLSEPSTIRWDLDNKAIIVLTEDGSSYIFDYKNRELLTRYHDHPKTWKHKDTGKGFVKVEENIKIGGTE